MSSDELDPPEVAGRGRGPGSGPADPVPPRPPTAVPDVSGLVRAVRRRADLSQRELAGRAGVSAATIGRIESRTLTPSLATLGAILAVAGIRLVAVDADDRKVVLMEDPPGDQLRDGGGRRYPSHLDTILDPQPDEWWGSRFGCAAPPETFHRNRALRDAMRRRSTWEVRADRYRGAVPPPTLEHWIQLSARCEHCHRLPPPMPLPFTRDRVRRYLTAAARIASVRISGDPVAERTPGAEPGPGRGG